MIGIETGTEDETSEETGTIVIAEETGTEDSQIATMIASRIVTAAVTEIAAVEETEIGTPTGTGIRIGIPTGVEILTGVEIPTEARAQKRRMRNQTRKVMMPSKSRKSSGLRKMTRTVGKLKKMKSPTLERLKTSKILKAKRKQHRLITLTMNRRERGAGQHLVKLLRRPKSLFQTTHPESLFYNKGSGYWPLRRRLVL